LVNGREHNKRDLDGRNPSFPPSLAMDAPVMLVGRDKQDGLSISSGVPDALQRGK
jgi:hypothetical protein